MHGIVMMLAHLTELGLVISMYIMLTVGDGQAILIALRFASFRKMPMADGVKKLTTI